MLRDGLRLVEICKAEEAARLHALHEAVRSGAEDFVHGRFSTLVTRDRLTVHLENLTHTALDPHGGSKAE